MDISQFQDFMEQVWLRAGSPSREWGILHQLEMDFDSNFVDGDSVVTIQNLYTVIEEMQRQLSAVKFAIERVIEDGEMGI